MDWLDAQSLSTARMHEYCLDLQRAFLDALPAAGTSLKPVSLMIADERRRGRFLTFRTSDAPRLDQELANRNIFVDHRGDRLRIGFGVYQDEADVRRLVEALREIR